jgi:hypothetical protein
MKQDDWKGWRELLVQWNCLSRCLIGTGQTNFVTIGCKKELSRDGYRNKVDRAKVKLNEKSEMKCDVLL